MAKRRPTPRPVHAFVDTNIFLDFYRAKNEATLSLLERLKGVKDRVISTYQVEMEFLKNRQRVLVRSLKNVKTQDSPTVPAIFADSSTSRSLGDLTKSASKKTELIRKRILRLLRTPNQNDVVYTVLEEVFHSESNHVLTRDMNIRGQIKRRARRRFLLGYPPRKQSDTSMGDALNWEWILHCGQNVRGRILIVSRDGDYGSSVNGQHFLNDQLLVEYRERVGPRRSIGYTPRLSDALKELDVSVPQRELDAETESLEAREDEPEIMRSAGELVHRLLGDRQDNPDSHDG